MPWTRAIPSLFPSQLPAPLGVYDGDAAYPTESTRPVSERLVSSWTPRIRCSRMEETSVGVAFASEA